MVVVGATVLVVAVVVVVGAIVVVVDEVVAVVVVLPQLVVKINTMMSEAMRRILYSLGLTRMRPS